MSEGLIVNMNNINQEKQLEAKNFGDLESYLHAAECVRQHYNEGW